MSLHRVNDLASADDDQLADTFAAIPEFNV
jgi:hypothetical protein